MNEDGKCLDCGTDIGLGENCEEDQCRECYEKDRLLKLACDTVRTVMTPRKFLSLTPRQRGYVVYMVGTSIYQPNVPNEENPYPKDSDDAKEWDYGNEEAFMKEMDSV